MSLPSPKPVAPPERDERVSIIIPCHNAERWVRQAAQSALDQSHPNREVIVVDDASTDASQSALEPLSTRILQHKGDWKQGNAARNHGMQHASGSWLQFLDADDYLLPTKIETQFAEAGDLNQLDVLYSPVLVDEGNGPIPSHPSQAPDPTEDLPTQWLRWTLCQTGGVLWRAAALGSIGGWNLQMPRCQDNELCLRALQAGLRFKFCPTPAAVYRIWSEDTVSRKNPRALVETKTTLIDQMLEWLRSTGTLKPIHRQAAGRACFELARLLAQHDLDAAAAYYRQRAMLGLIQVTGPAAPARFRLLNRLLGFRRTEQLAARLR